MDGHRTRWLRKLRRERLRVDRSATWILILLKGRNRGQKGDREPGVQVILGKGGEVDNMCPSHFL